MPDVSFREPLPQAIPYLDALQALWGGLDHVPRGENPPPRFNVRN